MKLKLLPLALIAVTLAMPPTAAAETMKSSDFIDQIPAAPANYTIEVYSRQHDPTNFILTSTPAMPDLVMIGSPDTRAYDASRLAANTIGFDREVSPSGDLTVAVTLATRLHMRNTNQMTAINERCTTTPATSNLDPMATLVDYGIVNRR